MNFTSEARSVSGFSSQGTVLSSFNELVEKLGKH